MEITTIEKICIRSRRHCVTLLIMCTAQQTQKTLDTTKKTTVSNSTTITASKRNANQQKNPNLAFFAE